MFGDMGKMMQQVKEMKTKMKTAQQELRAMTLTGSSRHGEITVEVSGEMDVQDVRVTEAALSFNAEQLSRAIKDALVDALKKSKNEASQKLGGVTGGMKLPGM